jgi:predicted nuclease with TOPRIM domain
MFKRPLNAASLDALHEQSVELIMHARRLQQEFSELREASKQLRTESMQLREDVRLIRRSSVTLFTDGD